MFPSGHHYVAIFVRKYPIWARIYIPLAEETLDEAEGVSISPRHWRQGERRVRTRRNATWLRYIQNVPFADIQMKDFALETQHLQTYEHVEACQ